MVLCARDQAALDRVAREIEAANGIAITASLDLRLPESADHLVEAAVNAFGSIDVVVNNAGATKRGEFENLTDEDWADGFALKCFGTVRLSRVAWPHLKKQRGFHREHRWSGWPHARPAIHYWRICECGAAVIHEGFVRWASGIAFK